MQKCFLLTCLFALIFFPKSERWGDMLSIASLVIAFLGVIIPNRLSLPRLAVQQLFLLWIVAGLLLMQAFLHYTNSFPPDSYQTLRFGRILVNSLGVAGVLLLYQAAYGHQASIVIPRHVLHCFVAHATLMLAMYMSPAVNSTLHATLQIVDESDKEFESFTSGYRISGLTGAWDATSGLQALGVVLLFLCATRKESLSIAYRCYAMPVLLFSVMISGRTGLVILACMLPLVLFCIDRRWAARVVRTLVVGVVLVAAGVFTLNQATGFDVVKWLGNSAAARCLVIFGIEADAINTGHSSMEETFEAIGRHYFLPESADILIWGNGRSGRGVGFYVPADNGIILNLHAIGLLGMLGMYGILLQMLLTSWSLRRRNMIPAVSAMVAILTIFAIDLKVSYMFARNGFSVMMVLFLGATLGASQPRASLATAIRATRAAPHVTRSRGRPEPLTIADSTAAASRAFQGKPINT